MRILIVPLNAGEGLGPLTRMLSVAEEAKLRGHEVILFCRPEFKKLVDPLGLYCIEAPTSRQEDRVVPGNLYCKGRLQDYAVTHGWCSVSYLSRAIDKTRQVIQSYRPATVVTEYEFSVPIAAACEDVPVTATTCWTENPNYEPAVQESKDFDSYPKVLSNLNSYLDTLGQNPVKDVMELAHMRAQLRICPSIPELQPELTPADFG